MRVTDGNYSYLAMVFYIYADVPIDMFHLANLVLGGDHDVLTDAVLQDDCHVPCLGPSMGFRLIAGLDPQNLKNSNGHLINLDILILNIYFLMFSREKLNKKNNLC